MTDRCRRHPDREGEWGLASHYLFHSSWQQIVKPEQTFGPLCGECRAQFIEWVCTRAEREATDVVADAPDSAPDDAIGAETSISRGDT